MALDDNKAWLLIGLAIGNRRAAPLLNDAVRPEDFSVPMAKLVSEVLREAIGDRRFSELPSIKSWAKQNGVVLTDDMIGSLCAFAKIKSLASATQRAVNAGKLSAAAATIEDARQLLISQADYLKGRTNGESQQCASDRPADERSGSPAHAERVGSS